MLAGKLIHSGADQLTGSDYSLVDFNRAGEQPAELALLLSLSEALGDYPFMYCAGLSEQVTWAAVQTTAQNENSTANTPRCQVRLPVCDKAYPC